MRIHDHDPAGMGRAGSAGEQQKRKCQHLCREVKPGGLVRQRIYQSQDEELKSNNYPSIRLLTLALAGKVAGPLERLTRRTGSDQRANGMRRADQQEDTQHPSLSLSPCSG